MFCLYLNPYIFIYNIFTKTYNSLTLNEAYGTLLGMFRLILNWLIVILI